MELDTTQQVLLIILSSALALFLVLAIAVVISVLAILKRVRLLVDKAQHVIESAETVGHILKKTATPMGIFHVIQGIVSTVTHKRK